MTERHRRENGNDIGRQVASQLARQGERIKAIEQSVNAIHHAILGNGNPGILRTSERNASRIFALEQRNVVSRGEFKPVKAIVYGGVSLALAALAGAVIKLVLVG